MSRIGPLYLLGPSSNVSAMTFFPLRARVQRHDDRVLRLDGDAFVHMLAGTFPDPVFVHAVFPGLLEYLYRAACDVDAFAVRHGLLSHGMVFGHILA